MRRELAFVAARRGNRTVRRELAFVAARRGNWTVRCELAFIATGRRNRTVREKDAAVRAIGRGAYRKRQNKYSANCSTEEDCGSYLCHFTHFFCLHLVPLSESSKCNALMLTRVDLQRCLGFPLSTI
jgi:hypothetical protein